MSWTLCSHEKDVRAVSFNSAGDYFVTGGYDKLVAIWKTNFDEEIDGIFLILFLNENLNNFLFLF